MLKGPRQRACAGRAMETPRPACLYWPGRRGPLDEMVPAVQRKMRKEGVGYIIIDSAVLAAGADPEKAETAGRYFGGLSRLGVPSKTIAHVTKRDDDRYPFGSIFYSNSARTTWNVKLMHDEGNVAHLGLFNRKANDDQPEMPIGLRPAFEGKDGPVTATREDLALEWHKEVSHADQIRGELRYGSRSVKELAEAAELTDSITRITLARMKDANKLGQADDGSGLWGLAAQQG